MVRRPLRECAGLHRRPGVASEPLFGLDELADARRIVARALAPTPQLCWPLLSEAVGTEVWVKHENHTPIGAFKVRGGLVTSTGSRATPTRRTGWSAPRAATTARAWPTRPG